MPCLRITSERALEQIQYIGPNAFLFVGQTPLGQLITARPHGNISNIEYAGRRNGLDKTGIGKIVLQHEIYLHVFLDTKEAYVGHNLK